jgi:regulator of replication initiation timing
MAKKVTLADLTAAVATREQQLITQQAELTELKRLVELTIVEATTLREQRDAVQAQLDKLLDRVVDKVQQRSWTERANSARDLARARGVAVRV